MRNRLATLGLILVYAALPLGASREDARVFIEQMVRGVGASPAVCSTEILQDTRAQGMGVVCAVFEGDFDRFEWRWTRHMLQDALDDHRDGSGTLPRAEPQTAWEDFGEYHERIYVVGQTVVGIRFHQGELILVYM